MSIKNCLYVGVDVSLKSLTTCILDNVGDTVFKSKNFSNDPNGVDKILDIVLSYANSLDITHILFGIEATSVYGTHLFYTISDSDIFNDFTIQCYCFEPKIIKTFRETIGDLPKNDKIDSWVIASRLRVGNLPNEFYINFKQLGLQRLTRFRQHIIQNITKEKTYLVSNLFLKFSSLTQKNIFSDKYGATAESLLTDFYSTDEIASMHIEDLIDFIATASKNGFSDIHHTANLIKDAACNSFKLKDDLNVSVNIVIKSCFDNISALEKSLKNIETSIQKQVKESFKNEYTILNSIGGIGPVISAGIIAEIGDVHRFNNDDALAKFAGLVWSQYQSGEFEAENTKLRKTGNAYLRHYLCQAANCMRIHNSDFAIFYSRKFKEVKSHQHKRAIVLTARKAVRVIFSLLQKNRLYTLPKKGVLPIDD
jgi:transposase